MTDPLVTLETFSEEIGEDFSPTDAEPQRALRTASAFVRSIARETFSVEERDDYLRGTWSRELQLPRPPVISVEQIELRYEFSSVYVSISSSSYTSEPGGQLLSLSGDWGGPRASVHAAYLRGYSEVPEDVEAVVLAVSKRLLVYADRFADGQVQDPAAGVSVGLTELEAAVLRRYRFPRSL